MTDRVDEDRSSDPLLPLPEQEPTVGPIEYADSGVTGAPELPDHMEDPTRRRHPTILSAEGEEEAPLAELPHRERS